MALMIVQVNRETTYGPGCLLMVLMRRRLIRVRMALGRFFRHVCFLSGNVMALYSLHLWQAQVRYLWLVRIGRKAGS